MKTCKNEVTIMIYDTRGLGHPHCGEHAAIYLKLNPPSVTNGIPYSHGQDMKCQWEELRTWKVS